MADIYWGDGIHEERLPLLEGVPEEEKEKELSPEEKEFIEQSLYEILLTAFGEYER